MTRLYFHDDAPLVCYDLETQSYIGGITPDTDGSGEDFGGLFRTGNGLIFARRRAFSNVETIGTTFDADLTPSSRVLWQDLGNDPRMYWSYNFASGAYDPDSGLNWVGWQHGEDGEFETTHVVCGFDNSGVLVEKRMLANDAWNPFTFNDFWNQPVPFVRDGFYYQGFDVNEGPMRINTVVDEATFSTECTWLDGARQFSSIVGYCSAGWVAIRPRTADSDGKGGYVQVFAEGAFPFNPIGAALPETPKPTPLYEWNLRAGSGTVSGTSAEYGLVNCVQLIGDDLYFAADPADVNNAFDLWKVDVISGAFEVVASLPPVGIRLDGTFTFDQDDPDNDLWWQFGQPVSILLSEPPLGPILGAPKATRTRFSRI